MAKSYAEKQFN